MGYAEYGIINSTLESDQWILEEASNTLSLNETILKNVTMFPNPANGLVTIQGLNHISNLTIYDVQGKQITIENLETSLENLKFSVKNFKNGIYFVKVENALGITTIKLVVQ